MNFPWLALPLALVCACSGISVQRRAADDLGQLRASGYRVAVLPFLVTAPEDGFLSSSLAPVGELFALELGGNELPAREALGTVMRRDVVAWLSQGSFEVLDPWQADTMLAHRGLDGTAMNDRARVAELTRALGVDGLVYGEVVRWNRSYYVLQSTAEVGLRVELLDGPSGRSLFFTERTESVGSGLTGGPTGFVSAATEPVAGLRASHLQELTRSVARNAALDLNGGPPGAGEAGALAPRLSVVALARPHAGSYQPGDRIEVIAIGTPDCDVRFDLGRYRTGVPLSQVARHPDPRGERATYAGHYVVQEGEAAQDLPLECTIRRPGAGRTLSRYRWEGLVGLGPDPAPATR